MTTDTLHLRRLAWAGVEIRLDDTRLLIDPLEHAEPLAPVMGRPRQPLPPVDTPAGTHALITHLHPDHYDHDLIARIAAPGTIGCHTPVAPALREAGLDPVPQEIDQPRRIGPFTATPVPSLDWRGHDSDQVAWIVEGGGRRIIHCGDTMWHGDWWRIARDHGPFDLAFVPVNGVIARFEGYDATVPVTMTPEHAIEAAVALGATSACAIHHGLFHNPPTYTEQPDIERRFRLAAEARGIMPVLVPDGALVLLG
ncbi:MBL fold metallo-hydrolase [Umezawaea sp. Da 62-37]|uniref:MBL fold metallo-hydrolase n=1 Tax=Umezawaea sp. Da 62-37 TaxID=3075927 RepID=UPI0028F742F0|nr:MBL fold metallo-hydrolase [Umezawaea sp. Da 62-37]WNV88040.1 MBL fold metallo-hydrolase [Umezawaea sp. Da 62-37]